MRVLCSSVILLMVAALGCAAQYGRVHPKEPIFYPPGPDPPRLQFLTSFATSADVEKKPSWLDTFLFGKERTVAAIQGPWGGAFHDGRVYVCDLRQATVLVLDLAEHEFTYIRDRGKGKLRKPIQCEIDAAGDLYVADRRRRQILRYGPDHEFLRSYGPLDETFLPTDVEPRGGELYVCDMGNRTVQVLDLESGEVKRTIGSREELTRPTNIALNEAGECHVVDTIRNRVMVYDASGAFLRQIGEPGEVVGQFGRAKGIDIDPHGYVYVVDAASEVCQIFTPDGEIALFFGGPGVGPGNLYLPTDVIVSEQGVEYFQSYAAPSFEIEYLVFVISQYGPNLVNVYGFGRSSEAQYE